MFGWLKKVWNKNYRTSEDGHKFGSRSRIERKAIKADTLNEVNQPCQCSCTVGNGQFCVCDVLPCIECKSCKCPCNYLTN